MMMIRIQVGDELGRDVFLGRLVENLYERNDIRFERGTFRVRGEVVDVFPAYMESAGYVLLEATVSGLPVLTTASCGYAWHIEQAQSGEVCSDPFTQDELNARLGVMLSNLDGAPWSENGLTYGKQPELYSFVTSAVRYIEGRANDVKSESQACAT